MAPGFWGRVREARLARVLVVYLAASWVVLQVSGLLQDKLQLPLWVTPAVLLLLVAGLVVILATAWVQAHPASRAGAGEVPAPWELNIKDLAGSLAERRLPHPTWARAILGGVVAFSLLFGVAGVYVLLTERRLEAEATLAARPDRKMLVVLPFENLGPADDEYFADGVTEEITARLAAVDGLGVIGRTSAILYKGAEKTIQEIGRELGVHYILEGTVRWQRPVGGPARVRITPQLVRVADGTHLWAEVYDEPLDEIFRVQSDVARRVVDALGVTLLEPARTALEARPTENLEAYDSYLRGNDYLYRRSEERYALLAVQMYERAVELDPGFALALAKLSEAHSSMYWYHHDRSKERLAKAKEAVDRAFELEPGLPEAHRSLGWYHYWGYLDYDRALEEFAVAAKSRPSDSEIFLGIAAVRRRQGRFDEAAANFEKALALDPRSADLAQNTAGTYALLREFARAQPLIDRAISLSPDWAALYDGKVWLYLLWRGDTQKAGAVLEQAEKVGVGGDPGVLFRRVLVELFDGKYQQALDRLSSGPPEVFEDQFHFTPRAQLYAQIYGLMKKRDLERAYYDSARIVVESKLREEPEDPRLHSALGIAYAGLGRKEEAIREGKKAVELLPIRKEAWRGYRRVVDLARIYVMVGEYDAAIERLEYLLSIPGDLTAAWLRIDPTWAPLRSDPGFQRLLEKGD